MPIKREFLLTPFDGPWYPGFLSGADACAGRTAGTLGRLVAVLEQHLGIPQTEDGGLVRLMAASRALRTWLAANPTAFFAKSFAIDPEGAAGRLLHWRDALWMGGWDGEPAALPPRLKTAMAALASAGGGMDALGLPGRVRAVIQTLEVRNERMLDTLFLLQEESDLEPLVVSLLKGLKDTGTAVRPCEVNNAPGPKGDLSKARAKALGKSKTGWDPAGDGSLLLVTATIPGEAAEALASWMETGGTDGMVLIVGDAARAELDAGLRLHHLAAVGSGGASSFGSPLQVLPLSLALVWEPLDPAILLEFLQLPLSPLPRWAGHRLARVLADQPGIENKEWKKAITACVADAPAKDICKDPKASEKMEERLDCWLPKTGKLIPRSAAVPKMRLESLCKEVAAWARRRAAALRKDLEAGKAADPASAEQQAALLEAAAAQADRFNAILDLDGRAEYPALEAARLLRETSTSGPDLTGRVPEAGSVFTVQDPGAVLNRARTVIWWDFTQNAAGRVALPPFTTAEIRALVKAGVQLPDPARAALRLAASWRRPLLSAAERIVLVTWESHLGEPQTPHPLWDQLTAGLTPAQQAKLIQPLRPVQKIQPKLLKVRTKTMAPQVRPALKRHWALAEAQPQTRETESASSLTTLVGCPFKYILEYQASARSASGVQLTDDTMLRGTLAHRVLQEIFTKRKPIPDENIIRAEAEMALDRLVREEGISLLLPGKEAGQARFRLAVVRAAVALGRILATEKLTVVASEKLLEGKAVFGKIAGYADMLLKDTKGKTYILDMKYSDYGDSRYIKALRDSEPVQLAVYAKMANIKAPVAYYSLGDAQLLTTEENRFPGGRPIKGVSAGETWDRTERSVLGILDQQFKAADVIATGVAGTNEEDAGIPAVTDGLEAMEPPCNWCDYSVICGRMWGEQEEEDEDEA